LKYIFEKKRRKRKRRKNEKEKEKYLQKFPERGFFVVSRRLISL